MIGNYDGSGLEPLTKAEIPKIGRIYDKLGHALIILMWFTRSGHPS